MDRLEVHPLGSIDPKVLLIFSSSRERRQQLGRQILPQGTYPELIAVGLAKRDLSLQGEIPVDENSRAVGMRVLIDEHQGARAGTKPGLLLDLVGIELGDRKPLHRGPIDSST